jgi:hypothetical protein
LNFLAHAQWIGTAGALLGALLGAIALTQPRYALRGMGLAPERTAGLSEYRAFGGLLLGSHAMTATMLFQEPRVGACFAGALAAGWFGAAFGRIVSLLRDGRAGVAGYFALDLVLGFTLAAPLWAYVRVIRAHAGL